MLCLQCFDAVGLGGRKGIRPVKNLGGCGGGAPLVRLGWRFPVLSLVYLTHMHVRAHAVP